MNPNKHVDQPGDIAALCPDPQALNSFLAGRLDETTSYSIELHIETCSACLRILQGESDADQFVDAVRLAGKHTEPLHTRPFGAAVRRVQSYIDTRMAAHENTVSCEAVDGEKRRSTSWLEPAQAPDELGCAGKYRILREIGRGGMGVVFEAEDKQLRRRVAVKAIRYNRRIGDDQTVRFQREAKLIAALRHPGIVTIYDFGVQNDVPYMVMELLEGTTLDTLLTDGVAPSVELSIEIGRQLAEALSAAHRRGILHRDIKPSNIWLESGHDHSAIDNADATATIHVKLLDFGLARTLAESDAPNITESGMILGTPAYMAPEQARGENIDTRADLFSLGCLMYRLLTGQAAFGGKDVMATLMSLANHDPPTPQVVKTNIPKELSDLVMGLLAKDRNGRPASAREIALELTRIAARHRNTTAPETSPVADSPTRNSPSNILCHPKRRFISAAAMASFFLLGIIVVKVQTKDGKEIEVTISVPEEVESATATVENESSRSADGKPMATKKKSPFDALDPAAIPAAERFDWQPRELVAVLGSHRQRLWGQAGPAALSADGSLVVVGGHYCNGSIIDTANGHDLPAPPILNSATDVALSPDGAMLLWKQDGAIGLLVRVEDHWSARKIELSAEMAGAPQSRDASFSLDGRWLTTSILHRRIDGVPKYSTYVWDVSVNPPQRVIDLHGYRHPSFSPDAQRLAVVGTDNEPCSLVVFDLSDLQPKRLATVPEVEFLRDTYPEITRHGFLASGALAAIDKSGVLSVWDVSTAEPQRRQQRDLRGSDAPLHPTDFLRPFRTGTDRILLWNQSNTRILLLPADNVESSLDVYSIHNWYWTNANFHDANISHDGRVLATTHLNGMIRIWELTDSGVQEKNAIRPQPVTGIDRNIVVSENGKHIATRSEDGFRVWQIGGASCHELDSTNSPRQEFGPVTFLNSTTFSTAGLDGLNRFKLDGNRAIFAGEVSDEITPQVGSPGGLVLSLDRNNPTTTVSLWQTDKVPTRRICSWEATSSDRELFNRHYRTMYSISADGRRLVTTDLAADTHADPVVQVWQRIDDTSPPTKIATIPRSGDQLYCVTLSPDGHFLAIAAQSGLTLWKVSADTTEQIWHEAAGSHHTVTFSPDGRLVASSMLKSNSTPQGSSVVSIHNLQGDRLFRYTAPHPNPTNIAFSPDGRHLLTANTNGTVYILRIPEAPQ